MIFSTGISLLQRSALIAALAGFLFGFDTVVISGAEQRIQSLWVLSDWQHGLAVSTALWGTVVGSLLGAWPADRYGRRPVLLVIGAAYLVSALWSALAAGPWDFVLARFLGGLGIGVSTVVAPLYITEIAPPAKRGRLTGLFQFNIVFGILVAYLSNALLRGVGDSDWRWMLAVAALPSLAYCLLCLGIPESPRWLVTFRGRNEEAARILQAMDPAGSAAGTVAQIAALQSAQGGATAGRAAGQAAEPAATASATRTGSRAGFAAPARLAVAIAVFNQLSGINAILYFAPRIFALAGIGAESAMLQSAGIGLTNLVFTLAGLQLIDRLGRRTLMLVGSVGYVLSLGFCAWAFLAGHPALVTFGIFAFIAAHAIGQGAVIWVFISEIFPNRWRATGQALGSATHWVLAAVVTLVFPALVAALAPGLIFLGFGALMVVQLIWVLRVMPETRGRVLEAAPIATGVATP